MTLSTKWKMGRKPKKRMMIISWSYRSRTKCKQLQISLFRWLRKDRRKLPKICLKNDKYSLKE